MTPSLVASPSGTKRIIVWGSSVIAPEVMVRWLMRSSWAAVRAGGVMPRAAISFARASLLGLGQG